VASTATGAAGPASSGSKPNECARRPPAPVTIPMEAAAMRDRGVAEVARPNAKLSHSRSWPGW
jgi:hypothetical protein